MKHLFWLHTCVSLSGYGDRYVHVLGDHVRMALMVTVGQGESLVGTLHFTHEEMELWSRQVTHPCSQSLPVTGLGAHSFSRPQICLCTRPYCMLWLPLISRNVSMLPSFTGAGSNCFPKDRARLFCDLLLLLAPA